MSDQKFHHFGVGFYADDEQAVARVTACVQQVAAELPEGSYSIREKAPAQDGQPREGGSFGMALLAMKCGKGATRPGLGGVLHKRLRVTSEENICPAYFGITREDGLTSTWAPTCEDLLAEDWEIVD